MSIGVPDLTDPLDTAPTTAILIRRHRFTLTVRTRAEDGRHYRKLFTVPVSIGAVGFETPAGSFCVLDLELDPEWTAPLSYWVAPEVRGRTFPAGAPGNPLRGSWIRLTDSGIGIHGSDSWPLGQKASHGCVRCRPKDAIAIAEAVSVGTPVTIV